MYDEDWSVSQFDGTDAPAGCRHQCPCHCHRDRNVRHVIACCTPCGKGHSNIQFSQLEAHLRECHAVASD